MEQTGILRRPRVVELTGRSPASIRRDVAEGRFPKPLQIGPRAIGWRAEEIFAWINSRTEASAPRK